jgi:predicted transcriptional regulator
MDIESLFSSTRWDIIKVLSKERMSPNELASELKTTPANVSQQLRLLELAGLVKSEKTKNVDKGKPRIIYSLASEISYMMLATENFADKKLLHLTTYHKYLIRTFYIDNLEFHQVLGKLFFKLEPFLSQISAIAANASKRELEVFIISESPKSIQKIDPEDKRVKLTLMQKNDPALPKTGLAVLYDPDNIIKVR